MKKSLLATLFLGLVLFLAACGGDDTSEASTSDDAQADNEIEIVASNWDFDQEEYTVNAGETTDIQLTIDEGAHGISIDELDLNIDGEGSATITPEEPGEYTIYCNLPCGEGHDEMTATLIVQ
ncbi:cupredoxin domain-containing protein [Oceanobacillus halotolerans]|uniref:cupredoxin domain-containing protein n=1 Tax=Oceanobacillus halotolerans TaxID=2663380 RepID=UPI0013DC5B53|nr:cupredoxin domain-containing protein [Oceanobacillus halotolerans]